MRFVVRVGCVLALLGVVVGMGVHYDVASERHSPYPDGEDLRSNYDAHLDEETRLFGTVTERDDAAGTMTIEVETDTGWIALNVTDAGTTTRPSGVVQVYGAVRPGRTIDASNVVVVNPSGSSATYKYVTSAIGALLVLVAFFRHWRFDPDDLAFEVSDDG